MINYLINCVWAPSGRGVAFTWRWENRNMVYDSMWSNEYARLWSLLNDIYVIHHISIEDFEVFRIGSNGSFIRSLPSTLPLFMEPLNRPFSGRMSIFVHTVYTIHNANTHDTHPIERVSCASKRKCICKKNVNFRQNDSIWFDSSRLIECAVAQAHIWLESDLVLIWVAPFGHISRFVIFPIEKCTHTHTHVCREYFIHFLRCVSMMNARRTVGPICNINLFDLSRTKFETHKKTSAHFPFHSVHFNAKSNPNWTTHGQPIPVQWR